MPCAARRAAVALPDRDGGARGTLVRHHRVAGVGLVLDQHLPIAAVAVAQRRALQHQPPLGRAVHHVVERRERLAEVVLEALPHGVQPGEHEPPVLVPGAHRLQPAPSAGLVEPRPLVALAERDGEQRPVGAEGPGVVGAAQMPARRAAGLGREPRALVGAAVVEDAQRAVLAPDRQDRLARDLGRHVVARMRRLAGVADVAPGVDEEVAPLGLEHLRGGVDVAVDLGLAHQRCDGVRRHGRAPRRWASDGAAAGPLGAVAALARAGDAGREGPGIRRPAARRVGAAATRRGAPPATSPHGRSARRHGGGLGARRAHRSSTSRGVSARETQGCMTSPAARSRALRITSRWSGPALQHPDLAYAAAAALAVGIGVEPGLAQHREEAAARGHVEDPAAARQLDLEGLVGPVGHGRSERAPSGCAPRASRGRRRPRARPRSCRRGRKT